MTESFIIWRLTYMNSRCIINQGRFKSARRSWRRDRMCAWLRQRSADSAWTLQPRVPSAMWGHRSPAGSGTAGPNASRPTANWKTWWSLVWTLIILKDSISWIVDGITSPFLLKELRTTSSGMQSTIIECNYKYDDSHNKVVIVENEIGNEFGICVHCQNMLNYNNLAYFEDYVIPLHKLAIHSHKYIPGTRTSPFFTRNMSPHSSASVMTDGLWSTSTPWVGIGPPIKSIIDSTFLLLEDVTVKDTSLASCKIELLVRLDIWTLHPNI